MHLPRRIPRRPQRVDAHRGRQQSPLLEELTVKMASPDALCRPIKVEVHKLTLFAKSIKESISPRCTQEDSRRSLEV